MLQRAFGPRGFAVPGIVAGLGGGLLIDAFLISVYVFGDRTVTIERFYQFVASGAVGKAAFANPADLWLGLIMHFAISAMWGAGYAYVAARTPQVAGRPLVSGVVFGVVVYFAMGLVEVAANIYSLPTATSLAIALVAHCLFFGVPIAFAVQALVQRESRSAA